MTSSESVPSAPDRSTSSQGVLRGALTLSVGTGLVRAGSAFGQLLLAFWLLPAEFGLWAAALASLTFFTSIANFGEVNGYLSGRSPSFARLRRTTRRMNAVLTAIALACLVPIWFLSGEDVAVLGLIVALSIPLQGESEVLYALGVKRKAYKRLVWTQAWASVAKLGLGVGLAVLTQSALALAIPTLVYYILVVAGYRGLWRKGDLDAIVGDDDVSVRERFAWAVNTLAMSLPLQIGFFVAQFVTDPTTLGIYYLSFQLSLGISGLLAVPLSRVALSAFGEATGIQRVRLSIDLSHALAGGVTVLVALIGISAVVVTPVIPSEWQPAIPVALIMLASLPIRLIGPVLEGYQQSRNQWWQSTAFNLAECIAIALIALMLAFLSLPVFALILTVWRLIFGIVRMMIVLRDSALPAVLGLSAAITLATIALTASAIAPTVPSLIVSGATGLLAAGWVLIAARFGRKLARAEV